VDTPTTRAPTVPQPPMCAPCCILTERACREDSRGLPQLALECRETSKGRPAAVPSETPYAEKYFRSPFSTLRRGVFPWPAWPTWRSSPRPRRGGAVPPPRPDRHQPAPPAGAATREGKGWCTRSTGARARSEARRCSRADLRPSMRPRAPLPSRLRPRGPLAGARGHQAAHIAARASWRLQSVSSSGREGRYEL